MERFKAIKEDRKAPDFIPGEYAQIETLQYLEPTHMYKDNSGNQATQSSSSGPDLFDIMGGSSSQSQQTQIRGGPVTQASIQNDMAAKLESIMQ